MLKTAKTRITPLVKGGKFIVDYNNLVFNENKELFGINVEIIYNNEVIATSDQNSNLPSPSLNFLTKYLKNLNDNNVKDDSEKITQVLVEFNHDNTIRVKPDNTITIKKLQDFWNRSELETILLNFGKWLVPSTEEDISQYKKWINDNL